MLVKRHEMVEKGRLKFREQARKIDRNAPDLHRLADSIVAHGQLEAIGLLTDFTVIWGNRRGLASLLRPEITHLDAVIFEQEISESEFRILQGIENFHQETLKPHEKTLAIAEMKRLNEKWTNQDVAKNLSLDPASVTRLLSVFDCIAPVKEAYFAGQINGAVYAISRMPQEQQSEALAMALSGATRDQLESHRKKIRKGKSPAVHVQRLRCPLPSGVTVQFSGDGITLETALSAMIDLTKELKRAIDNNLNASTVEKVLKDKAKATA